MWDNIRRHVMFAAVVSGKCRTLIVEDDPTTVDALSKLMRHLDHPFEVANTLAQAIQMISSQPACLILDLMLPDGNGIELLRRIRRFNLPIKVAVATALEDPQLMKEIESLNPDAMFKKPIELSRLMDWLASA